MMIFSTEILWKSLYGLFEFEDDGIEWLNRDCFFTKIELVTL